MLVQPNAKLLMVKFSSSFDSKRWIISEIITYFLCEVEWTPWISIQRCNPMLKPEKHVEFEAKNSSISFVLVVFSQCAFKVFVVLKVIEIQVSSLFVDSCVEHHERAWERIKFQYLLFWFSWNNKFFFDLPSCFEEFLSLYLDVFVGSGCSSFSWFLAICY